MWAASPRPLSSEEMAVVEQNAVALGVSLDNLMENAGRAVAEEATRRLPAPPARVAVVASTGNNGGDGACCAHYLHQWGFSPEIWIVRPLSEVRSRAARRCFERIERTVPLHAGVPRAEELATMPLIVDALLGTGQRVPLRPPIRDAVDAIRKCGAPVLSVDLPTGTGSPDGLTPTTTVALTVPKQEMDPRTAGELVVRDIGIPPDAWRRTGPGEFVFFRVPSSRPGRGRTSRLVVIGGGPYAGAPALAALAALRSGVERATVLAPQGAAEKVQGFSPTLVVHAFGEGRFRPTDVPEILDFIRGAPPDAIAIGMGAGAHPETLEALGAIERALAGSLPMLVDADGLAALPSPTELQAKASAPVVATPNAGEFARLFSDAATLTPATRVPAVSRAAREGHLFLVAKGDPDLLSDGQLTVENLHHHPAMTVAGSGDVLAGVVAGQLAQGLGPLAAARLGTYWVGEAGIVGASRRSFGLIATDVIDELPAVLVAGLARTRRGE